MIFLIGRSRRNVVSRRRRSCGYEQSHGGRRFGSNLLTFVSTIIFASMPAWSAHAADLTVNTSNAPSAATMRLFPVDTAGRAGGLASLTRTFNTGTRVWLTAPLRSSRNYFVKWQKDGVDFDTASTTSLVIDASHTLTAVYETPNCAGVPVYPGTDSLKNAVTGSPAGSTFCIKAGTHRFTSSVVARQNDKFIGEGGAILNGSKLLTTFVREGSYWVATGQTQQEPPAPTFIGPYPMCAASSPACIYPEKVFRNGIELVQVPTLGAVTTGRFFFDYPNNKIYMADDPTGRTIEATTGSGGIISYANSNQGFVTVKNLTFEKFGGGEVPGFSHYALKTAEGWRVENNEFRRISEVAIALFGSAVLRNNNIHHNGKYHIVGSALVGGIVEGNSISYNNVDGFDNDNDAGVTKFQGTVRLKIRGNLVANNTTIALWADFDNIDMLYENNWVENNLGPGIFHEISCAAIIRNNIVRGNSVEATGKSLWWGAQIFTRSSKDVEIYGNDLSAIGAGVHGVSIRGADPLRSGANCGTIESRNVSVHDNVIRLDATDSNGVVGGEAPGYGVAKNIHFTGNTYFLTDLAGSYFWYDAARTGMSKEAWQGAGEDLTGKFIKY